MKAVTVRVPAKVNLHLEVLGRRPDGFHELRTLFASIGLWDEVAVTPASGGVLELEVSPAGAVGAGDDNLVLRAARAVMSFAPPGAGARFRLAKSIPVGAGLGGGSADAAAALVALDRAWDLHLPAARIHRLAAGLGSDVPFFLTGGLALGVGRGEEVYPLPDALSGTVLLLVPPVEISTASVYSRLQTPAGWRGPDPRVYSFAAGLTTDVPWTDLRNDLQDIVVDAWPEVGSALDELGGSGAKLTAVTGSGAAVFAVFDREEEAQRAAGRIGGRFRRIVAPLLPRAAAGLLSA